MNFQFIFVLMERVTRSVEHINVHYANGQGRKMAAWWDKTSASSKTWSEFFILPASPSETAERYLQVYVLNFLGPKFLLL